MRMDKSRHARYGEMYACSGLRTKLGDKVLESFQIDILVFWSASKRCTGLQSKSSNHEPPIGIARFEFHCMLLHASLTSGLLRGNRSLLQETHVQPKKPLSSSQCHV